MGKQSLVLLLVFAVAIISLISTPDDAFAANTVIQIPSGATDPNCNDTPDTCFSPSVVVVSQYDTVQWMNDDSTAHTAVSGTPDNWTGLWATGLINPGSTSDPIVMSEIGNNEYFCSIHPWQVGTLDVGSSASFISIPLGADDLNCSDTPDACYSPDTLTIVQGVVAFWINNDVTAHTTNSDDGTTWSSGNIPPGDNFFLLTDSVDPGIYPYHCNIHPWQVGTLTIDPDPSTIEYHTIEIPAGTPLDPNCSNTPNACYNPDSLTAISGDIVTWTNNDSTTHTTTSDDGTSWDSGNMQTSGVTQGFILDTAGFPVGNYPYSCTIHPWQVGTLTLLDELNFDPIPEKIQTGNIIIDLEPFVTDLISPTHLTHNGDGSGDVYIVDQPGFIYRADSTGLVQATPFLDISSQVYMPGFFGSQDENDFDERGLLGLAFHPDYNQMLPGNGLLYTFHSEAYPVSSVSIPLGSSDPGFSDPTDCSNQGPNACYNPDNLGVTQGEIVEWTNDDTLVHTITSDDGTSFDSGNIAAGDTFQLDTSTIPVSIYPYHCSIHPWQVGTLSVFPGTPTNPDFGISMTGIPDNIVVVTEWQVDGTTLGTGTILVDPATERRIMTVAEPQFNHEGGMLGFLVPSEPNFLYISLGDGGSADDNADGHTPIIGNAQDESNLLGSLLRIDPLCQSGGATSDNGQYCIPAGNPNVGESGELDEIFAHGLRNTWRLSYDPGVGITGADVGQNQIEEINLIYGGENFGWNEREGTFGFDSNSALIDNSPNPLGLTAPWNQYDHDEGISIIGGYTYTGSAIPELDGLYVFGDFSTGFFSPDGRLFYTDLEVPFTPILEFQLSGGNPPLDTFVKSFGEDQSGELYVLVGTNLGPYMTSGGVSLGQVLKIVSDTGGGLTGGTEGQVNILAADTCGLSFTEGAPISYGSLIPGQESAQQTLTVDNTGNTLASLLVRGSAWVDGELTEQMAVSDSHYSLNVEDAYGDMTPLDSIDAIITASFDPDVDLDTLWTLLANIANSFQGSLTQTIDFTVSC